MFLPWKLWSNSRRIISIVVVVVFACLVAAIVIIGIQVRGTTPLIPITAGIAGVIALASFAVTAGSAYATWVRNRKKDTLEAWQKWIDGSRDDRRVITDVFGQNSGVNDEQAIALTTGQPMVVNDRTMTSNEVRELRRTIVRVLSGLERLAVGIEHSLYDLDLIMEIGGTILVATFDRMKPYVLRVQNDPDEDRRKTRAYVGVAALVSDLESESARRKRKFYDRGRVLRIRRASGGRL
ncbi:MAG TPA: DUF4760 domain-containing protein [Pseudolysinimonas sp.]|nr:DUF4760 domain-containing protein [Pseudolysinimonas sp.]